MNEKEQEIYIKHVSGIYYLLEWVEHQKNQGMASNISNEIIYFHPLISRYFSLGVTKNKKYGKELFFASQPEESIWFSLIQWDKTIIQPNDIHLYFISKKIKGDNEDYPDIPQFGISFSFDSMDKINMLKNIKQIIGREYFQDENKLIKVNFHKKLYQLPLFLYEKNQALIENIKVFNSSDIMRKKEQLIASKYSNEPEFKGDIAVIPGSESLFDKLKKKLL